MRPRPSAITVLILSAVALRGGALLAQGGGAITGRVTGPAGEPLPGASVSVTGTTRGTIVRSDGTYQINLPAGRYELRTRSLGYAASAESVTVASGATTTKNFAVERIATNLETVAIIGSRGQQRTVISAPVPIDVLSVADLQQSGRTETAQMLEAVAPSVNFPRATIADGSDHIRPTPSTCCLPSCSSVWGWAWPSSP